MSIGNHFHYCMPLPKKLLQLLESKKAKYDLVAHKKVFTAWDCAQTLHVKPSQVVKTLVLKLQGKDPVIVLLGADRNLDQKKFVKVAHNWLRNPKSSAVNFELQSRVVSRLSFADEAWMKKKIIGRVGATLSFGSLLKFPTFVDKALLKQKALILGIGSYEESLAMKTSEFLKVEPVVTGSFSEIKKLKKKKKKNSKA